jgi:branched-chain amino acid transport system substrate-binding protein
VRNSGGAGRSVAGRLGIALVALLAVVGAGCSSSASSKQSGAGGTSSTTAAEASSASLLGPTKRAVGTPVKIGLITNGNTASGANAGGEAPVAKAAVGWINEHADGVGGHPITLEVCTDDLDPGKTADCANQMIRDNVAAVVIGSNGVLETSWKILHDAKIPVINNAATESSLLGDSASTFIVNDPLAQVVNTPIALAKEKGANKVSVIVLDLPIATDIYKGSAGDLYKQAGLGLDVVPVALGTPDMTPQAQQIESNNPNGLVDIVGNDSFCLAALNGLHAVGYSGSILMISQCMSDALRKGAANGVLNGVSTVSLAPIGDAQDPSMRQYAAILNHYNPGKADPNDLIALMVFQSLGALSVGTQELHGPATPASITAALKAMPNAVLPASGGRHFRCNGKASPERPAVCSVGVLAATLDAQGNPTKYTVENDNPIGN